MYREVHICTLTRNQTKALGLLQLAFKSQCIAEVK